MNAKALLPQHVLRPPSLPSLRVPLNQEEPLQDEMDKAETSNTLLPAFFIEIPEHGISELRSPLSE
jgi:hypothetical protein